MTSVTATAAWRAVAAHAEHCKPLHLKQWFTRDPQRYAHLSLRQGPFLFDFSKQRIDPPGIAKLVELARQQSLGEWIERLFRGEPVNGSEARAALHTALRMPAGSELWLAGRNVVAEVQANLTRMARLVERIHRGQWRGFSGKPVTDVVNIGVGGSDLGPLMACHALAEFAPASAAALRMHFVSSMDGSQLDALLDGLNPETTLFIISSKSFTTVDTLSNARTARAWLAAHIADETILLKQHFIGVSASPDKMSAWGIPAQNQLLFWDWVGGRYSMWSAIGLPIALTIGMEGFRQLLAGAHAVDEHFRHAPFERNLPVLMALLGIWNTNFLGIRAHAILPYDGRLRHLPAYLEQLEMESNGKSVTRAGAPTDYHTCPVLWGEIGPNAQHAFYQLLHQGTEPVMCDFIAPARRYHEREDGNRQALRQQHRLALANCFAQSRLLALGDAAVPEAEQAPAYKRYHGNQPSSTLLLDELSPYSFGGLIALYEHKVFAQAVIWEINPFDQWGVELGKKIATHTLGVLQGEATLTGFDASTQGLLTHVMQAMEVSDHQAHDHQEESALCE